MSCSTPIDDATLAGYWMAELPADAEQSVEEHLLACDECGGRLREIAALAEGIRGVIRVGALRVVLSRAFLERLAREGLRIREYAPPAGGDVACTVTPADDLVTGRLAADLADAHRLDLAICDAGGTELGRLSDIPFNSKGHEVIVNESTEFLRTLGNVVFRMKLLAVDESGERLLGEYTFRHSPSF
jgi:hypothetical protein